MIDKRIKLLREGAHMTQAELARRLGITRSSVNAWELGISVPSTQYLMQLATLFGVTTDYLLGRASGAALNLCDLTIEQTDILYRLAQHFRSEEK